MYDRHLKIAISKIRLHSHLFYVERRRGGRQNVAKEDRKCNLYDIIGDDFHCLFKCLKFANEKRAYIPD